MNKRIVVICFLILVVLANLTQVLFDLSEYGVVNSVIVFSLAAMGFKALPNNINWLKWTGIPLIFAFLLISFHLTEVICLRLSSSKITAEVLEKKKTLTGESVYINYRYCFDSQCFDKVIKTGKKESKEIKKKLVVELCTFSPWINRVKLNLNPLEYSELGQEKK